jgi:hypothetical protein
MGNRAGGHIEQVLSARKLPSDPGIAVALVIPRKRGRIGKLGRIVDRTDPSSINSLLRVVSFDPVPSWYPLVSRVRLLSEDGIEISHGVVGGDAKNSV